MDKSLRITEVFYSLQGEARTAGQPTVFVRLTGCPLRCQYCDSEYAFFGGEKRTLEHLLEQVLSYGAKRVCVTGGEPLAQPNVLAFLTVLCEQGLEVSLETSGALSLEGVDPRVSVVMDLKTPGSGELDKNFYENIQFLQRKDQLKFVICDRRDYDWARFKLDEYQLFDKVGELLFSPSYGQLDTADLAQWILDDKLDVRLQVQLHKIIWGDVPGV